MIAPWHTGYPGMLTGSVYAAPPSERIAFARELAGAGMSVHVDMMDAGEGLPAGVSLAELNDISRRLEPSQFDVHLIGSAEFADDMLPALLDMRPGRVFLPWTAFDEQRAADIRNAGSTAWIAVWEEWTGWSDGLPPPWPATPDGALVMLIEPGTKDRCHPERLDVAAACAVWLPVIVDGGITEDIAPLCVTAGVEAMVVGRALLAETPGIEKGI
ncbi:ribulose phosphate epimerase [Mycobacterium sp. LTG2003]